MAVNISAKDVMELRKRTDCGMMECKKALVEAEGDFEKAVEILRERGMATAAKKAGRIAAEGVVYASYDAEKKVGVALEVNAETDFVAKNDKFVDFVKQVAEVVASQDPADVEALMACKLGGDTVEKALTELIAVIKENIKVRRFARFEGVCSAYVHGGGSHAVLVKFDTDCEGKEGFEAFGKDVAMQVAAANPSYVFEKEVPQAVLDHEKEILMAQLANDPKSANKPEAIKEKMVLGRLKKFYTENCLADQEFVKDNSLTVNQYVQNTAKAMGGKIELVSFVRFEKGEGLEKRQDDFAAEVAAAVGGN